MASTSMLERLRIFWNYLTQRWRANKGQIQQVPKKASMADVRNINRQTIAINFTDMENIFRQHLLNDGEKEGFLKYCFARNEEQYMLLLHDLADFNSCEDEEDRKFIATAILDRYLKLGTEEAISLNVDMERVRVVRARIFDEDYVLKNNALSFLEKALIDKLLVLFCDFLKHKNHFEW
jgi:hypothetical protein